MFLEVMSVSREMRTFRQELDITLFAGLWEADRHSGNQIPNRNTLKGLRLRGGSPFLGKWIWISEKVFRKIQYFAAGCFGAFGRPKPQPRLQSLEVVDSPEISGWDIFHWNSHFRHLELCHLTFMQRRDPAEESEFPKSRRYSICELPR